MKLKTKVTSGPRGVRTSAAATGENLPSKVITYAAPIATGVAATSNPLSLSIPPGSPPVSYGGTRPAINFRPIADYSNHRELQTNSHIALLAQSFSTTQRNRPVETQVGWNPRSGRIVIAQNNRQSASKLLAAIRSGSFFAHAKGLVTTPTPVPGTTIASQLAEEAGSAAKKIWMSFNSLAGNSQEKKRKLMITALLLRRIDVVTRGAAPHAELQIAPLIPPRNRDNISGTKLRCATCALAMGTHSVGNSYPVTGGVFPGTASSRRSYRNRTLVGSVEQTTTGVTRARSMSAHK